MKAYVALACVMAGALASADDFGPIGTRNYRVFSLPFLRFVPRTAVLDYNEKSMEFGWTVSNDARFYPSQSNRQLTIDAETSRFTFVHRQGLANQTEYWIEAPVVVRGGGFMDPIIDWWHRSLLGSSGQDRTLMNDGACEITTPTAHFGSAWGLGDVTVGLARKIHPQVRASVAVKLPTGNDGGLLGSGNVDVGASLDVSQRIWSYLTAYGQLAYVFQGNSSAMKGARVGVDQQALSLVCRPNSRDAWIVQWQNEPSGFRTKIGASDVTHRILSGGYQRKIDDNHTLELFFSEDHDMVPGELPELINRGPDFTMGLRWIIRWR